MNNFFFLTIGFILGFLCNTTQAQTTYLYGPQGQSLGTAFQSGSTTYYYGAQGQSAGTAMQSGNTTYYYGPQGQPAGTVMSPNTPVRSPAPIYNPSSMTPTYDSIFGR
jgi:YD repeat-containing protein